MYESLIAGAALFSVIFSGIALLLSCVGIAIIVGFKSSTHRIEYRPIENPFTSEDGDEVAPENQIRPDLGVGTNPFTKAPRFQDEELVDYDEALLGGDWSNKR